MRSGGLERGETRLVRRAVATKGRGLLRADPLLNPL
jgi:hypothetical protein